MDRAVLRNWSGIAAEMAGTFLFLFVGIGAVAVLDRSAVAGAPVDPAAGLIVVALAHGLVLAVLVSALGVVSGAHFNPAVTFGVWLTGRIPGRRALAYVIAQLIGGILAALALRMFTPQTVSPGLGTPVLGAGIDPIAGIGIEAVLTAVLLIAVFGTAIDPRGPKVGGLAIGLALVAGMLMGGPLTGGAVNPARWFGPAAVTGMWDNGFVWVIGPLLGAAIAALAYRFVFQPQVDLRRTPAEPTA